MTASRLWPATSGPGSAAADNQGYTMAMQFSLSSDAALTGIFFWTASGAGLLPEQCGIFKVSDHSIVASNTSPSWSGSAGSGQWVKCTFNGSVTLQASTAYKVAVSNGDSGSNWYSATSHYWDSGDGASGITSGIITAPANAGADVGQDAFHQASPGALTYPDGTFNAGNYWVDVEVTTAGTVTSTGGLTLRTLATSAAAGIPGTGNAAGGLTLPTLAIGGTVTVIPATPSVQAVAAAPAIPGYGFPGFMQPGNPLTSPAPAVAKSVAAVTAVYTSNAAVT